MHYYPLSDISMIFHQGHINLDGTHNLHLDSQWNIQLSYKHLNRSFLSDANLVRALYIALPIDCYRIQLLYFTLLHSSSRIYILQTQLSAFANLLPLLWLMLHASRTTPKPRGGKAKRKSDRKHCRLSSQPTANREGRYSHWG